MKTEGPDIKIFVSRRIDIDSVLVDNPLYVPIRCGAAFDQENPQELCGDDAGDSISRKRGSFCEFTVQYWAWKNMRADYFGLCHYRRYLSFAQRSYPAGAQGMVMRPLLSQTAMKDFGLLNQALMEKEIAKYDLTIPCPAPVWKMPLPHGKARTVRQLWEAHDGIFFDKKVIGRMFALIDLLAPEYSVSAREYFDGGFHRGYNCYVMRQPLFDRLCRFQFPIMDEVEAELNAETCNAEMKRTPAYVGEMLFGIFLHHVTAREDWRVSERQLVFFSETRDLSGAGKARCYFTYAMDRVVRAMTAPLFPLGSRRRQVCKALYYRITKRSGGTERDERETVQTRT